MGVGSLALLGLVGGAEAPVDLFDVFETSRERLDAHTKAALGVKVGLDSTSRAAVNVLVLTNRPGLEV